MVQGGKSHKAKINIKSDSESKTLFSSSSFVWFPFHSIFDCLLLYSCSSGCVYHRLKNPLLCLFSWSSLAILFSFFFLFLSFSLPLSWYLSYPVVFIAFKSFSFPPFYYPFLLSPSLKSSKRLFFMPGCDVIALKNSDRKKISSLTKISAFITFKIFKVSSKNDTVDHILQVQPECF